MITAKKLQALQKRLTKQEDRLDKVVNKAMDAKARAERTLKMTTNHLDLCYDRAAHVRGQITLVRALLGDMDKEPK